MNVADGTVREGQDAVGFNDLHQMAGFVFRADAAGHVAVLGNGILQIIGDHGSLVLFIRDAVQAVSHCFEGILAVVIVRIDDGKRLMYLIFRTNDSMDRSIRLRPVSRRDETVGQCVIFLERVIYFDFFCNLVTNHLTEGIGHALADDKDHLVKAGFHCVINGILHQDLTVGADPVNLLVATIPGSQTCGHDKKGCVH